MLHPLCQLRMKGCITLTAPSSVPWWVVLGPCFPSMVLLPAAIKQAYAAHCCCQALGTAHSHREHSLEWWHRSGLARFYFTFTFTDSSSPLRKGRLRLLEEELGSGHCTDSGTVSFHKETVLYLRGPHSQVASDMVAVACSSVPGR